MEAHSIVFAVSILIQSALALNLFQPKVVHVDKMEMCEGAENLNITMKNMVISQVQRSVYAVNGNLEFHTQIQEPWTMVVKIRRCSSPQNPKSCEKFRDFTVTNLCEKVIEDGQMWSGFLKEINMNQSCPIQPAEYPIVNVRVGTAFLQYLPVSKAFFRLEITNYVNDIMVFCLNAEMNISPAGKRNH